MSKTEEFCGKNYEYFIENGIKYLLTSCDVCKERCLLLTVVFSGEEEYCRKCGEYVQHDKHMQIPIGRKKLLKE